MLQGRMRLLLTTTATLLAVAACTRERDLMVWEMKVPSPDGSLVASASTLQNGGFGSSDIETTVYLEAPGGAKPVQVLSINCPGPMPHPYALDNIANRGGSIDLGMTWLDRAHLYITYRGPAHVDVQLARASGVEITVEALAPQK